MADRQIDRDKLHVAIRRMSKERLLFMLDTAIDLLPRGTLPDLVEGLLDLDTLRARDKTKGSLLADVKAFQKATLARQYYEDFRVNSSNYMEKSGGTQAWIEECNRLLARCVAHASRSDPKEVCRAIEMIAALLDHIDECLDDIIFFADEAGSWQVGVNWAKVLPAWFTCLSATTEPETYARRVVEIIAKYDPSDLAGQLAVAKRVATAKQRKALRENIARRGPKD